MVNATKMTLEEQYIYARWCYAVGEQYMGDMEYRYLEDKVREQVPDCVYLDRSWSDDPCPVELLRKLDRMDLIKNVDFVHKSESIRSIFSHKEYEDFFKSLNEPTWVSYKLDGWNTQINYYNGHIVSANTRGRSGNFMDASVVMKVVPQTIPVMGKVKVTGETVIPNSVWNWYRVQTGNKSQRTSVSTVFANGDEGVITFKAFNIQVDGSVQAGDVYDLLTEYGFDTPMRVAATDFASLDRAIKILDKRAEHYDFPTDGVVVENTKSQVALRIYRWEEKGFDSYITGYQENVGSYGNSMVVLIREIDRGGSSSVRIPVTNINTIVVNNLRVGAPIAFDERSKADAVFNAVRTADLQKEWEGKFDEYRSFVEERECSNSKK